MTNMPKWFDDEVHFDENEGVKDRANKLEKEMAKRLGGMRQPASGALWGAKGDMKLGKLALGDNKSTKNKSISVSRKMWTKLKNEALSNGIEIPFLELTMQDTEPLVVVSENTFKMLIENLMLIRKLREEMENNVEESSEEG